jgi:tetratricopeptide (TPR) repeat protein
MSVYPGNTSLASAVKEKVNSTFQQTLALYRQGRTEEVIAGCNLILQMDPMFDPAKRLMEKTKNPSLGIDVEKLGTRGSSTSGPLAEAREAMAARDFQRVVQITTEVLTNDLMNEEARVLADEAREKIEANPFIEQFVRKCEKNVMEGNLSAARTDLEKARALDSTHPGVRKIEELIKAKESGAPAVASSSFVVDTPAPAARSTTQASDFGFTFEEDKPAAQQQSSSPFANFSFESPSTPATPPADQQQSGGFGGFSFDAPASSSPGGFSFDTPAPTPAGGGSFSFDTPAQPAGGAEYDFSTASIETTPDDQKKIEQYLAEGDRAFDGGNYQQAIDLWSRIFLIDVTNEAASERIERAKGKRRESEQRIEAILAAGVQAFERKDLSTARTKLAEVLQLDPNNVTAQDYMERLDMPAAPEPDFAPSTASSFDSSIIEEGESATPAFEIPSPAARKPAAAKTRRPAATSKLPMGLIAAVIAAVVLIGGGWFVWSKFISTPKADAGATSALLDRATEFSQQGKYDQAIAVLQDIKPGDAQYDKALVMIADLQTKKARQSAMVEGRPATAFYEENVNAGRTAFEAHDYVSAKKSFEQAMRVKPLPPDVKLSYDAASQQVAKLENARALFGERKYADVITSLQPMLQQDPQNKNLQRMIIDAHFNLGATALQEERIADAKSEFDEVLKADPNDELAKRSKDLAERYDGQPKDLLYRIYVKYLPLRAPAG